ncbi:MAG: hypothetical protein A2915_00455 [Candidatus Yanofskybacteria bacterium RIFCSPLOWO2_01_FULL_41_34]|uniref:Uncharacterized protein n=1 Tax=Candidatus Yanofskybacteria bacterium RIFCSPHIGHO2_01_FULL_41_26 TaxID=1802661 RepID=A0A1F8EC82_9BACT|nr:MAG: hypothetical protein A2649_02490 [Candidatus Yanofskybacteria bacterium RIFCSPHIGHO2_01_FULL_41_26]OGN22370.1 MAG: hypothetical protein A2915_00455 [Candidatus Yanofskybacteria bacterium RIFCSPLOWO2_01_FULL_41_34]
MNREKKKDLISDKQEQIRNCETSRGIIDQEVASFGKDSDLLIATLKEGKDVDSEEVREIKAHMVNRLKKIEELTKNL